MVLKKRLIIFYVCILLISIVIFLRLSYLKIIANEAYLENAIELWTRDTPISLKRGLIKDRNGKIIVGNEIAPSIVVIPKQIEDVESTALFLSEQLNVDINIVKKHLTKNVSVELLKPFGQRIKNEIATNIIKENLKGVYVVKDTKRKYINDFYLAPVLGIVGSDNQGLTGLEYQYDSLLKGSSGAVKLYVDAHGNSLDDIGNDYKAATTGFDLYLTIDLDIQLLLERVIDNACLKYNPDEVIAIISNPKNLEIYAMASRPSFSLTNYEDYDKSLYNRNLPIFKTYEPGSVSKIVTFASGLENNVFKIEEEFYDPGYAIINGVRVRDWKAGGHGKQTFLEVFQNSCNPGFMELGLRLGKNRLINSFKKFGYGEKTGIDLIGETTGILFKPENMSDLETATSAFGQGISTSAIQLVQAASAACNGGNLIRPSILKGLGISGTNEIIYQNEPFVKRKVISKETSKIVASSLEHVVAKGTGRSAYIEGYRVGGKTGTAQIAENGKYLENSFILSFLGIAPMNDPEVLVYIALVNPKNTIQYGGVTVGPMVKEVLEGCFRILNINRQTNGVSFNPRYWIDKKTYLVENYIGFKYKDIISPTNYHIEYIGSGEKVIKQNPEAGSLIIEDGTILLYLGD